MRYDPPEGAGASISRRDVLGGLAALGTAALAGCSVDARLTPDGRLRIGTLEPPVTLDPIEAEYVGSKRAIALVFDGLYTYGEGSDVVSEIAAGDPEVGADGRQYAVEIDDSARFQNGDSVTATDVRYSFEALATEDTATAWRVSMIESIETPDDRTVRFRLAEPYPAFDHVLALPVVSKAVREEDREAFASEPVGAGPFEVKSFGEERTPGLDRWDDDWGDPAPALTGVTMVAFESPITQMTSLRTGRHNAIQPVAPQIADDVESVTDGTIQRRRRDTTYYLGFNLNEGPATDLDVRKGTSRCIDLDEVVDQFVQPTGERAYSPLPPEVAAEWELPTDRWEELSTGKDVGRARQLFGESDHGGDLRARRVRHHEHPLLGDEERRRGGGATAGRARHRRPDGGAHRPREPRGRRRIRLAGVHRRLRERERARAGRARRGGRPPPAAADRDGRVRRLPRHSCGTSTRSSARCSTSCSSPPPLSSPWRGCTSSGSRSGKASMRSRSNCSRRPLRPRSSDSPAVGRPSASGRHRRPERVSRRRPRPSRPRGRFRPG